MSKADLPAALLGGRVRPHVVHRGVESCADQNCDGGEEEESSTAIGAAAGPVSRVPQARWVRGAILPPVHTARARTTRVSRAVRVSVRLPVTVSRRTAGRAARRPRLRA